MTAVQWDHVEQLVNQVKQWSGWPKRDSLAALAVSRTAYYRWRRSSGSPAFKGAARPRPPQALLASERAAVIRYALEHPNPRHRELAWKMVDDDVAYVSPSSVYRILREEGLVPQWPPKRTKRRRDDEEKAHRPDERWQSDIRYIRVGPRRYYLVLFIDEYSRYVVHHELMCWLDGDTLSLEAQRAIETLAGRAHPVIQTDNGSNYISNEFKKVLKENEVGSVRIKPRCPEENGLVERAHRTLGEVLDEIELEDLEHARQVTGEIVRWYNHERLHSALQFLRPIDYYRGDPHTLIEQRRRELVQARHRRREVNLEIKQRTMCFEGAYQEGKAQTYSESILRRLV